MSKPAQLAVSGLSTYSVTLTEDAKAKRAELLETASLIINISNPEDQAEAVQTVAKLKAWKNEVEKTRKELKEPVLAAGRLLDATAADASKPAEVEIKRIEALLVDFQREQNRIREEALRKQRDEQERIAREQAEKERQLREEAARLEAERQRLEREALEARSKKAREEAAAKAKQIEEQQIANELAADFKQPVAAPAPAPLPEVAKPTGAAVKKVFKWEVTDIEALFAAFPQCVRLEPNAQQINYLLATPNIDISKIPGLHAWEDTAVVVRSTAAKPETLTY